MDITNPGITFCIWESLPTRCIYKNMARKLAGVYLTHLACVSKISSYLAVSVTVHKAIQNKVMVVH